MTLPPGITTVAVPGAVPSGPGAAPDGTAPTLDARRALRNSLDRFATGVAVVTCVGKRGRPAGVTVSSFTPVSLDPPMILWCLARDSSGREAFEAAGHFTVNVLAAGQREWAARFAGPGDPFRDLALPSDAFGVPVIPGATATLSCRPTRLVSGGDHLVVLGEVLMHSWSPGPGLLFADGAFHAGPASRHR